MHNGDKDGRELEEEEEPLEKEDATGYRGVVARLNYLAQDCPDLQFPALELSREMDKPTSGSWRRMKKVARYLVDRKKIVWRYPWQD